MTRWRCPWNMNRAAQALSDALAGNVRLWVSAESYTQAHVRNLLVQSGVPVIWERSNDIRVSSGRLTRSDSIADSVIELLWEPEDQIGRPSFGIAVPVKRQIKPVVQVNAWMDEFGGR